MAAEPAPSTVPREPERTVEATFRNGSMTVVGVLTAFSLGILMQRTDDPTPWHPADVIVVVPMAVGILAQLVALKRLLQPESLEVRHYSRAIRLFLWGVSLLAAGVLFGVIQDAITAV